MDFRPGARYLGENTCEFLVWAPRLSGVDLALDGPPERLLPMHRRAGGYWELRVENVAPGARYRFRLGEGVFRPDPASHWQPEGVHAASAVADHGAHLWQDGSWGGVNLSDLVLYELHPGAFTPEGTLAAAEARLPELAETGVTAVELMPLAAFPGTRNWGYDGVYPYAVQDSYGGPAALKSFVDAAHRAGLAVVLDVVYNHLGPEGNYLRDFGPYFTKRYATPWGEAVNYDGPGSDEVRRFFIGNALHWFEHYHADALRLDAVHAIYDASAYPFLTELADEVRAFAAAAGRECLLIAESDLNDSRLVRPKAQGGCGLHAAWSDDFHHALHARLTGERDGYYADFGGTEHLARVLREGYAYAGQYSAFRDRRHGNAAADLPPERFVVSAQNHDQVGNRMQGERLSALVPWPALKTAALAVILSPYLPLLFMGEEYGETAPFQYFVDHGDPDLVEAVRRGRREEFAAFRDRGEPPDPADPGTLERSRLRWDLRSQERHAQLLGWYRDLLHLRRSVPALFALRREGVRVAEEPQNRVLQVLRREGPSQALVWLNLTGEEAAWAEPRPPGRWRRVLDAGDARFGGDGSALPAVDRGEAPLVLPPWAAAVYLASDQ